MSDIVLAVLSSSGLATIVTLLVNWLQNRKKNSLTYITGERVSWREKIRDITSGIGKCKYKGFGKKSIEQYLIQLEMNINPYGRTNKSDYQQDGHIWEVIKEIREAKKEEEFECGKKLLLSYLSVMLKDDWERSKKEVRGYSYVLTYVWFAVAFLVLYLSYFFIVLRLDNVMFLVCILIINYSTFALINYCAFKRVDAIKREKRSISIDKILKKKRKMWRSLIIYIVILVVYLIVNVSAILYINPSLVIQNMKFVETAEKIYVYTELDADLFIDLEKNIENCLNKEIILIKEVPAFSYKEMDIQNNFFALIKAINKSVCVWNYWVVVAVFLNISVIMIVCTCINEREKKSEWEVEKLKCILYKEYKNDFKNLLILMDRIDLRERSSKNKDYFGLMHSLLSRIERELCCEIGMREERIISVENYEVLKEQEKCRDTIIDTKKIIKRINKTICFNRKEKLFNKIKKNISNIGTMLDYKQMSRYSDEIKEKKTILIRLGEGDENKKSNLDKTNSLADQQSVATSTLQ